MHCRWTPLLDFDKEAFLRDQRVFSKEKFDSSKIELSSVDLSFYPGHVLVPAKIDPQSVQLDEAVGLKEKCITEPMRSYFLYNPWTDDLKRKVVPLAPERSSVDFANWLLDVKINDGTVIDYIKFFGLLVEYDSKEHETQPGAGAHNLNDKRIPFLFISRTDEIPFNDSIDPMQRERLIGALSARTGLDGRRFVLTIERESHWLFGSAYFVELPCIWNRQPFSAKMAVNARGRIKMSDDEIIPLSSETFSELIEPLPYYLIQPTTVLKRAMKWSAARAKLIVGALSVLGLAILLLGLVGTAFNALGLSDVLIGAVNQGWTQKVDDFLRAHPFIVKIALLGLFMNLIFGILGSGFTWLVDNLGSERPSELAEILEKYKEHMRTSHPTFARRIRGMAWRGVVGVVVFTLAWGCIFYALDVLGFKIYAVPDHVSIRTSIGYCFDQVLGWLFRGQTSGFLGPLQSFVGTFGDVKEITSLGTILRAAMFVSIPILVTAGLQQFWRWTADKPSRVKTIAGPTVPSVTQVG